MRQACFRRTDDSETRIMIRAGACPGPEPSCPGPGFESERKGSGLGKDSEMEDLPEPTPEGRIWAERREKGWSEKANEWHEAGDSAVGFEVARCSIITCGAPLLRVI